MKDGPILLMGLIHDVLLRREPAAIIPKALEWRPITVRGESHTRH